MNRIMMTANKRTANDTLEMTTIISLKPTPASKSIKDDVNVNVTANNGCIGTNAASENDKENTPFLPNATPTQPNADDDVGQSTISKNNASTTATTAAAPAPTTTNETSVLSRPREVISKEISKQVLRHKLQKLRHLVLKGAISEDYLDKAIFHPKLLEMFDPQTVVYNGGVANVKEWKISCYLEVMEGGVPCTNPHLKLLDVFLPLLETCDDLFLLWYKQQHACNSNNSKFRRRKNSNNNNNTRRSCKRLMTFVTRYTPAPGEQALLKHIDGAGKVDGSCVVALPFDKWSTPTAEEVNSWYGHGGGLTFWDGREPLPEEEEELKENVTENDALQQGQQTRRKQRFRPKEIHYETRPGDVAFIDRAVWHQADPITKGTRWALVIFYKVTEEETGTEIETNESSSRNDTTKEEEEVTK